MVKQSTGWILPKSFAFDHAFLKQFSRYFSIATTRFFGGRDRNRTGIRGFAVLYITTLPPGPLGRTLSHGKDSGQETFLPFFTRLRKTPSLLSTEALAKVDSDPDYAKGYAGQEEDTLRRVKPGEESQDTTGQGPWSFPKIFWK